MKTVFLAWRDPIDKQWLPVGRLSFDGTQYEFVYTHGAKVSTQFMPFGRMQDLDAIYQSTELFPLFANRLLSPNRPEYQDLLSWLNMRPNEAEPLALLARLGGRRETDELEVFPYPTPNFEGKYEVQFFIHGWRYVARDAVLRADQLRTGEQLFVMPDPQNAADPHAIGLRTTDPKTLLGYCPRYLAVDIKQLLQNQPETTLDIRVQRVNLNAPRDLRVLCRLISEWPQDFHPCSGELFEPMVSSPAGT